MLTLFGHPYSRAHRVLWMLKELGLPYEHVPTDFLHGGTRDPEFLKINPNGRVPALTDGTFTIFESLAINLYLAQTYGGDLAGETPRQRALAIQWSIWVITEIEKPLLFTAANLLLFAPEKRRPAEATIGLRRLDRPFAVINAQLHRQPFLLGDDFSVADINVAGVLTLAALARLPLAAYPALQAWLDACLARPQAADWKPISFTVPRPDDAGLLAMFL